MRLDYTLYVLAILLLIMTLMPFVVTIEGVESDTRSLWMVTTIVLGLLSIGLGYSQRPKTKAQACQLETTKSEEITPQTQSVAEMETTEEKISASMEAAKVENSAKIGDSKVKTVELTLIKGIGEKRAKQLKALGIDNFDDLSKASAKIIGEKLKTSSKTVDDWIANARELLKKST